MLGLDGGAFAYLDMGWPDLMVAVEYDGDHHRVDRCQYVKDIRRLEALQRIGWPVVRVVAEDHPAEIVRRVACPRRPPIECVMREGFLQNALRRYTLEAKDAHSARAKQPKGEGEGAAKTSAKQQKSPRTC